MNTQQNVEYVVIGVLNRYVENVHVGEYQNQKELIVIMHTHMG